MTRSRSVGGIRHAALLRRARLLGLATRGWNVVGVVVLGFAAVAAQSIALASFGLDSPIKINASTVVLWELTDIGAHRQGRALRLIRVRGLRSQRAPQT